MNGLSQLLESYDYSVITLTDMQQALDYYQNVPMAKIIEGQLWNIPGTRRRLSRVHIINTIAFLIHLGVI